MGQMLGRKLLASLIDDERHGSEDFLKMQLRKELFKNDEEDLFDYVDGHYKNYGALPSRDAVLSHTGDELPQVKDTTRYYYDEVRARYVDLTIKAALVEVAHDLGDKNPMEALSKVSEVAAELNKEVAGRDAILNFTDEGRDLIYQDYVSRLKNDGEGKTMFGWPKLDEQSGGMQGGDVVTIVGRPGAGKTYLGLNIACRAWQAGKVVLFVSMEMQKLAVSTRLAALRTKSKLAPLKKLEMTDKYKERLFGGLDRLEGEVPFWIMDGNLAATVSDITMYANQLRPDLVIVDGAYLLSSKKMSKHEKIADTVEGMKREIAMSLDIPVVASYQFNREMTKQKEKSTVGLEHIAGSDAISQISSIVLGLFEDTDTSVESVKSKEIQIMKGREGETGAFRIHWLFDEVIPERRMCFDEIPKEETHSIQLNYVG